MAAEAGISDSSVDTSNTVEPDALSLNVNSTTVNSAAAASTTVDTEKPSDATNGVAADNAGGKKRKKGKKDGAVNAKPAEPPGQFVDSILSAFSLHHFSVSLFSLF